tara:strand:- start:5844 stop:6287 length:444 start_codon:yes stop_codon:yes gene_type:complete
MEEIKQSGINLGQIKSMLDEIENMTAEEHVSISTILKESGVNFTENDNGIFVKVNRLSLDTIYKIYNYVEEQRKTRQDLETAIRSLETNESISNMSAATASKNTTEDVCETTLNVPEWKKEIIEKMQTTVKGRGKKRTKNQKQTTEV